MQRICDNCAYFLVPGELDDEQGPVAKKNYEMGSCMRNMTETSANPIDELEPVMKHSWCDLFTPAPQENGEILQNVIILPSTH